MCPVRRLLRLPSLPFSSILDSIAMAPNDDDSSSDEDMPIGQLKNNVSKKPDKVVSSSFSSLKKKRPSVKKEEDDSDDDFASPPPKKKKIKTEVNGSSINKAKLKKEKKPKVKKESSSIISSSSDGRATNGATKGLKQMDKAERIAHAMQAYLWWDAEDPPKGCQWVKMEHAGVSFPEPYIPHGVKMRYDGEEVDLSPLEEEA